MLRPDLYDKGVELRARELQGKEVVWEHNGKKVPLAYFREWMVAVPEEGLRMSLFRGSDEDDFDQWMADTAGIMQAKTRFQPFYSWAIPSPRALDALASIGPLVEIGAGTGYWAYLLRQGGVDIMAYDIEPYQNTWAENDWTEVLPGGPEKAADATRSLFLCWPPYNTEMGAQCLTAHMEAGGTTVAYIGEGAGGCTGNDEFHDILASEYTDVQEVTLPQWWGLHDYLGIYRRKGEQCLLIHGNVSSSGPRHRSNQFQVTGQPRMQPFTPCAVNAAVGRT